MPSVPLQGKEFNYLIQGTGLQTVVPVLGLEPSYYKVGTTTQLTGVPDFAKPDLWKDGIHRVISYNNNSDLSPQLRESGARLGSITKPQDALEVKRLADECLLLLKNLGVDRCHVFAHRNVAFVAIRLALDNPDLVRSLSLLELELISTSYVAREITGRMQGMFQNPEFQEKFAERMRAKLVEKQQSGQAIGSQGRTVDEMLTQMSTSHPQDSDPSELQMRARIFGSLGISLDQFRDGLKGKPILSIDWGISPDPLKQSSNLLKSCLPQTESILIPMHSHILSGENTEGLVNSVIDFVRRYPIVGNP